jgi:hypothetical protein
MAKDDDPRAPYKVYEGEELPSAIQRDLRTPCVGDEEIECLHPRFADPRQVRDSKPPNIEGVGGQSPND